MIDTLKLPGHTYGIVPMRREPDTLGRPRAFVEARGGNGREMYVLRREDSAWSLVAHLGYGTKGVRPVPSPAGSHHLVWSGLEEIGPEIRSYLVMNEFAGDSLSRPDTVTTIWAASDTYGAAASPVRRWAAAGDYGDLRVLYSDGPGGWIEVPVPEGRGDEGVAVAALDDPTALVAWRDLVLGPGAGILRGSIWTLINDPPMTALLDGAPRLRPRPSDGHSRNGLTSVCVCVPGDSGFTVAENLAGLEERGVPGVARDRNQDVWVVWEAPARGMGCVHSYTRATSSAPIVAPVGGKRIIGWWLSEPAPGSWWAVLWAREGGPIEEVARVQVRQGLGMSWDDLSPPGGVCRYRIRRECMDRQYR